MFSNVRGLCNLKSATLQMIETEALRVGILRWTPVAVMNVCVRAFILGIEVSLFIGMPTLLFIWAAVGSGSAPGLNWCIFKGIWGAFVALPVFSIVFLSAIDKRHFRAETEFEQLVSVSAAYDGERESYNKSFEMHSTLVHIIDTNAPGIRSAAGNVNEEAGEGPTDSAPLQGAKGASL